MYETLQEFVCAETGFPWSRATSDMHLVLTGTGERRAEKVGLAMAPSPLGGLRLAILGIVSDAAALRHSRALVLVCLSGPPRSQSPGSLMASCLINLTAGSKLPSSQISAPSHSLYSGKVELKLKSNNTTTTEISD